MRNLHVGSDKVRVDNQLVGNGGQQRQALPNRLLTAFEVAVPHSLRPAQPAYYDRE
jgi:hypothetical protein